MGQIKTKIPPDRIQGEERAMPLAVPVSGGEGYPLPRHHDVAPPLTTSSNLSTWPHVNSDVGLEEGGILAELFVL